MHSSPENVLEIRDLSVQFDTDAGVLTAVDSVSFSIAEGEVVGLVGESGCGKSVTSMSIPRLVASPPGRVAGGEVFFGGRELLGLPIKEMRKLRGREIGVIFQEPMTALSPLHRIGKQLMEAVLLHRKISKAEARELALEWLVKVGIPDAEQRLEAYPYELSGGMRQRVMIAMALILEPRLIIADEPTTALDVTIQAQVLELMLEMKGGSSSMLLITHDMGVIWETCDRVLVMYASRLVEDAKVEDIFANPLHPYTEGLLNSMPAVSGKCERLPSIPGQVPSLLALPDGCNFADRCKYACDICRRKRPEIKALADGRRVACHLRGDTIEK